MANFLPALMSAGRMAAPLVAGLLPSAIDSAMTASHNADLQEGETPDEGHPLLATAAGIGLGALTHHGISSAFPTIARSTGTVGTAIRAGDASKVTPAASASASGKPVVTPQDTGSSSVSSPFPRLTYTPEVGSPPPAQPMSEGEDFRRFLASETRAEPNTPPIMRRKRPLGLPYDASQDIHRQMRENPEIPE